MHYMYGGQCVVPGARLAEVKEAAQLLRLDIFDDQYNLQTDNFDWNGQTIEAVAVKVEECQEFNSDDNPVNKIMHRFTIHKVLK